jgi:hypothetical protein
MTRGQYNANIAALEGDEAVVITVLKQRVAAHSAAFRGGKSFADLQDELPEALRALYGQSEILPIAAGPVPSLEDLLYATE